MTTLFLLIVAFMVAVFDVSMAASLLDEFIDILDSVARFFGDLLGDLIEFLRSVFNP